MPQGALQAINHQGTGEQLCVCRPQSRRSAAAPGRTQPSHPACHACRARRAGAEVFVAPGFMLPSFTATTAFGAGRLYVDGMSAQEVTLLASG